MKIGNFTPEDMKGYYTGRPVKILAGNKDPEAGILECDDSMGNHLLSQFNKKGLVRLEFKDNMKEKIEESMDLYHDFWEKQVQEHNAINQRQKQQNLEYIPPSKELIKKAKELGFSLLGQDWEVKKDDDKPENGEIKALKETVSRLTEMVEKLQGQNKVENFENEVAEPAVDIEPFRNKYKKVAIPNIKAWIENNIEDVNKNYPKECKVELAEKYLEGKFEEPCPIVLKEAPDA